MGADSNEAGLARGVVGSARVIAFGASNVAPAGSVVAGLVIVVSYAGFASPLVVLIAFVAVILQARHPSSFETLGRVFMPADGQPAYPLESAGNLAAGHGGQEGNGAHDGGA
jgi:hypothetical protein